MLALALLMLQVSLVSCTGNTYTGDVDGITAKSNAITFGGKTGVITRATGPEAATALDDTIIVYGFATNGTELERVFDHYTVCYENNSANSSLSNTAGWEYVGKTLSVISDLPSGAQQSIKYWDFSADSYDFIAFSAGEATIQAATGTPGNPGYPGTPTDGKVIFTHVDSANLTTAAYTITGAPADLAKVYIADRVTATNAPSPTVPNRLVAYKDAIQFAFKPLAAKVRIGLYEIIPGYSVKDVRFYLANDNYESTLSTTPIFFAGSAAMPSGVGTVTIKFNPTTDASNRDYNKVQVASIANNLGQDVALKSLSGFVTRENIEGGKDATPGQVFLGRTSAAATISDYQFVIPTGAGHSLTLKMDYTLLSTDKSQETIKVRGATAIIPSEFANWQPNCAYTYLFKISANTNGWTNPNDPGHVGLYPITFDAVVAATEEGMQQTITLMDAPSITTYAKGERVHEDAGTKLNYYKAGDYNLYICLQPSTLSMNSTNTKMYVVTPEDTSVPVKEAAVADAIKDGTEGPAGTFKDDPFTITVTTSGAPALTIATSIPAIDAPYGTAIPGNFAVFRPTTAGIYVFEYTSPEEYYTYDEYIALSGNEAVTPQEFSDLADAAKLKPNKHYKVIVVK